MVMPMIPSVVLPQPAYLPFFEAVPWYLVNGTAAIGANVCNYIRLRPAVSLHTSSVRICIGTQSGNVDVGVCTLSGTTMTKVASSGSTAVGTTGVQTIALAFDWVAGQDYYASIACDNGTATFARFQNNTAALSAADNLSLFKSTAFPIANQSSVSSGNNVLVWMRFV